MSTCRRSAGKLFHSFGPAAAKHSCGRSIWRDQQGCLQGLEPSRRGPRIKDHDFVLKDNQGQGQHW